MFIKSIKYCQHEGEPGEWELDKFELEKINLLVGKNASGKTRTINILFALSNLVSIDRKLKFKTGDYLMVFDDNGKLVEYILKYEGGNVIKEVFKVDSVEKMTRGQDGTGKIKAEDADIMMNFKAPNDEITAVVKRDSIQHPYLDGLYEWGENTFKFEFGGKMGKDHFLALLKKQDQKKTISQKDPNKVVAIFYDGIKRYEEKFKQELIKDFNKIGYKIKDIDFGPPNSAVVKGPVEVEVLCLNVKEEDLHIYTDQIEMSQGMFRALSLLIHLNYSILNNIQSCFLIDDIGEGLDYERASNLIKLVIEKAKSNNIQIIMSTNDRFVMNNVPLEYWAIINREGSKVKIFNRNNSKEMFEDFKYTGLNNFDLFSSDFYLKR